MMAFNATRFSITIGFSFHKSLRLCYVLECLKLTYKVLFLVVANHQLAAAYTHRNTSVLQGAHDQAEVITCP